jgi:ribonuclease PH
MARMDGRAENELRPIKVTPGYLSYAEGSALIEQGETRVLCAVSVEDRVPPWLIGSGQGWVTAEYSMLPRSTLTRTTRDRATNSGRSQEISRLIGRSLRAVTDMRALGQRSLTVDCDVIQADGGTRTAAITASYIALHLALQRLSRQGAFRTVPLRTQVAATSVGIINGQPMLDLDYEEDSGAGVDFNVVMTGEGKLVEVQGTAERFAFTRAEMDTLLDLAEAGIQRLFAIQREVLGS